MSMRYKGSRLSATANTPTSLTASGAWTLQQQMQANGTSTWPFVRDPQFNYVTMLLHGDGSAGANNGSGGGATPTVTAFNTDASTNNFNLTINGDARSNNFNPYQSGYYSNYFDGSGDYLSFANNTNLNLGSGDFTIECWFYHLTGTGNGIIWSQWNNGGDNSGQLLTNGTGLIYRIGATQWTFGTFAVNTWNHLAVSRSGSTVTMFLNGVVARTETNSTNITTTGATVIGANDTGTTPANFFNGYISNFRQVKGTAVYTSAFTPPTTPLTAITNTQLLTCQSNRFIDNSTNAFTITVNGNTAVAPAQPFTLPSSVATYGSGYFDGSGDYLTTSGTGSFNPRSTFTVEFWTYPITNNTVDWINSNTNDYFYIETFGGTLYVGDGSANTISTTPPALNCWTHVLLSFDGTTYRLFYNGVSQATSTTLLASNTISAFRIGQKNDTSRPFNGYINDLRVLVGTALYTSAFTPPTSPLTAVSGTSLLTTQYNGGGNNSGFKDSSQNNFAITRNGNTTQGTFTPYGSNWSNNFNGSNAGIQFPYTSSLTSWWTQDFTIEMWVYNNTNAVSPANSLCLQFAHGDYTSASTYWAFGTNASGQVDFYYYNGSGARLTSTTSASLGTWNHIAMVYTNSSGNISLYLNGVSVASGTKSGTPQNNSGNTVNIGAVQGTYYNGFISNLRVLNGTALYTGTFTPSTAPLTAITNTQLLTCQSNRFKDNSTNNATPTLIGSPSVQRFSPFANATAYNPATTGGSAYFAGSTTNYLNTAASPQFLFNGNFTIEGWFYKNATGTFGGLFGNYTTNAASNWTVQLGSSNQLTWYYDSAGVSIASTFVVGQWNHVACVRNGSTLTMYLNGVSVGTATFSTAYGSSSKPFLIGTANSDCINGYVSDVRVVNGTALYTAAFTPPTAPLTPTPSTQLLLSNTNSAILDQSMMNDLETVGNAQISTSVVKYGTASMYFDGTGDYLQYPFTQLIPNGTESFTIECWVNVTANKNYNFIFSAGYPVQIYISSSGIIGTAFNDADNGTSYFGVMSSTTAVTTGTWYHVAVTRSGSNFYLFVNGVLEGTASSSNAIFLSTTYKPTVADALNTGTSAYCFNGYLDDLRITKGYARYTATFTPPTQALPNG